MGCCWGTASGGPEPGPPGAAAAGGAVPGDEEFERLERLLAGHRAIPQLPRRLGHPAPVVVVVAAPPQQRHPALDLPPVTRWRSL